MNLMDEILNSNTSPLSKIGLKFGVGEEQISQAVREFLPALTKAIRENISQEGGMESLIGALANGNHDQYLDNAESLVTDQAVEDGNGILGHLLKNKENSKQLAKQTSENVDLDYNVLKQVLPLSAGLVMGALKKQSGKSGLLNQLVGGNSISSGLGSLISLLDGN